MAAQADTDRGMAPRGTIVPEQALLRSDRPLVAWGFDWTTAQTLCVAAALAVAVVACVLSLLCWLALRVHPGLWMLGWLGVCLLAGGVVARLALALLVEGRERTRLYRWQYRLQFVQSGHHARCAPPQGWRLDAHTLTLPLSPPRRVSYRVPHRYPQRLDAWWPCPDVEEDGCYRRADGHWVTLLDVLPQIVRGQSPEQQETLFAAHAGLLTALEAGEVRQYSVDNTPLDADGLNAALDALACNETAAARRLRTHRQAWVRREFAASHTPQAAYRMTLEAPTRAELEQRRDDVRGTLSTLGYGARALTAGEARRALEPPGTEVVDRGDHLAWEGVGSEGGEPLLVRTLALYGWATPLLLTHLFRLPLLGVRSRLVYTFVGQDQERVCERVKKRAQAMTNSDLHKRRAAAGVRAGRSGGAVLVTADEGDLGLQTDAGILRRLHVDAVEGRHAFVACSMLLQVYGRDQAALDRATATARRALGLVGPLSAGVGIQRRLTQAARPLARAVSAPELCLLTTTRTARALWPYLSETPGHAPMDVLLGRSDVGGQAVGFRWNATAAKSVVLLGDQGMGKSGALALLIDAAAQAGEQVVVLDPSDSFGYLRRAYGGAEINLLAPGVTVNLLQVAQGAYDNYRLGLLDTFEAMLGVDVDRGLDPWQRAALDGMLAHIYAQDGVPCLDNGMVWLEGQEAVARAAGEREEATVYRRLRGALAPYSGEGTFASLFNGATTADLDNRFVVVNTRFFSRQRGPVAELGLYVATTVADYVARRAAAQGVATRTFIDEMHTVLRLALRWMIGAGRYIRHDKNSLAGATHRLSDIIALPEVETIMTAINTWIIVRLQDRAAVLFEHLGIDGATATRIRSLTRTKGERAQAYFYTRIAEAGGAQAGFIDLKGYPELLTLVGTYEEQRAALDRLITACDGDVIAAAERLVRRQREEAA